jgi:hypothetical protein
MITSDYGRSASDTPHPRTPAAQLQLAGVSATSSRIGAVQVSAYVHTTSPHRLCAQVPTPINFDDPLYLRGRPRSAGSRPRRFTATAGLSDSSQAGEGCHGSFRAR